MTDQELKDIVAAVVAELEKSGVDFDYKADQAKDDDLVFVIRGTAPDYQGVTVTWKGLLDIITAQATQAKTDAETAKNTANTILTQVQSKGTEITNFVATSKAEIETQKNESVNAVKSVYQTDLDELKGDLIELQDFVFSIEISDNRLNPDNIEYNKALHPSNGETHPYDGVCVTGFCDISTLNTSGYVTAVGAYYSASSISVFNRVAFYNNQKEHISTISSNSVWNIEIPENAVYARFQISMSVINDGSYINIGKDNYGYNAFVAKQNVSKIPTVDSSLNQSSDNAISNKAVKIEFDNINNLLSMQKEFFSYKQSENLFDNDLFFYGNINVSTGELYNTDSTNGKVTDFISIPEGTQYLYGAGYNSIYKIEVTYQRVAFYDANKTFIVGLNSPSQVDKYNCVVTVPENAKYVRFGFVVSYAPYYAVGIGNSPAEYYRPYKRYIEKIPNKSPWYGKTALFYGDSITAIGNHGTPLSWQEYAAEILGLAQWYGRGIGGQRFVWNLGNKNGGSVSFIDSNGDLESRNDSYDKDSYTGEIPSGCTAVRGAFSSWDRITHMIPSGVKDSIDLIFIMGGTNDIMDDIALQFVESDTTDSEWASSTYYSTYGGDYNINTMRGGLASTIMKMQAWCPNAVIVYATPLNGQTQIAGGIKPDTIPDEYEKGNALMDTARKFGIPTVDVFGTCGINVLNSNEYITDGTHPYSDLGHKQLGRTVAGGLLNILPRIK